MHSYAAGLEGKMGWSRGVAVEASGVRRMGETIISGRLRLKEIVDSK